MTQQSLLGFVFGCSIATAAYAIFQAVVFGQAEAWDVDHMVALCNGGEHRESNLAPALREKHREKTAADVAEKSIVARKRAKHLGIKKPSRFPGSRDSGWKKRMDGSVVRR